MFQEEEGSALHQLFKQPQLAQDFVELLHKHAKSENRDEAISKVYQWLDKQQKSGTIQRSIIEIWRYLYPLIRTVNETETSSFLSAMRQNPLVPDSSSSLGLSKQPHAEHSSTQSQPQFHGTLRSRAETAPTSSPFFDAESRMVSLLVSEPEPLSSGELDAPTNPHTAESTSLEQSPTKARPEPPTQAKVLNQDSPQQDIFSNTRKTNNNLKVLPTPNDLILFPELNEQLSASSSEQTPTTLHTRERPGPRRRIYQTGNYPKIERIRKASGEEEHPQEQVEELNTSKPSPDAHPAPLEPPTPFGHIEPTNGGEFNRAEPSLGFSSMERTGGFVHIHRTGENIPTALGPLQANLNAPTSSGTSSRRGRRQRNRQLTGNYPQVENIKAQTGTHRTLEALRKKRAPKVQAGLDPSAYRNATAQKLAAPDLDQRTDKEKAENPNGDNSFFSKPSSVHSLPLGLRPNPTPFSSESLEHSNPKSSPSVQRPQATTAGASRDALESSKPKDAPATSRVEKKQPDTSEDKEKQNATSKENVQMYRFSSQEVDALTNDPNVQELLASEQQPKPSAASPKLHENPPETVQAPTFSQDDIDSIEMDIYDDIESEEMSFEYSSSTLSAPAFPHLESSKDSQKQQEQSEKQTQNAPSYQTIGEVESIHSILAPVSNASPLQSASSEPNNAPVSVEISNQLEAPLTPESPDISKAVSRKPSWPTWAIALLVSICIGTVFVGGTFLGKMWFTSKPAQLEEDPFYFQMRKIPVLRVYRTSKTLHLVLQTRWNQHISMEKLLKKIRSFSKMPIGKNVHSLQIQSTDGKILHTMSWPPQGA